VKSPGIWLRYFSSVLVSVKKTKFVGAFKKARALFVDLIFTAEVAEITEITKSASESYTKA
jgi:hypothetical protein